MNETSITEIANSSTKKIPPSASRNYSFLHRNPDSLDVVEDGEKSFVVPAQPGSTYWAILKVGYENHDKPIKKDEYILLIAELLEDRDPCKWEKFKQKSKVKSFKNGIIVEKNANDWKTRIEANIQMMTRHGSNSPYGIRLIERGHILRFEYHHFNGEGAYVLRTDTNKPLNRTKGRRLKDKMLIQPNINT